MVINGAPRFCLTVVKYANDFVANDAIAVFDWVIAEVFIPRLSTVLHNVYLFCQHTTTPRNIFLVFRFAVIVENAVAAAP